MVDHNLLSMDEESGSSAHMIIIQTVHHGDVIVDEIHDEITKEIKCGTPLSQWGTTFLGWDTSGLMDEIMKDHNLLSMDEEADNDSNRLSFIMKT